MFCIFLPHLGNLKKLHFLQMRMAKLMHLVRELALSYITIFLHVLKIEFPVSFDSISIVPVMQIDFCLPEAGC